MKLLLNIEALNMVGMQKIFMKELTIKAGQSLSSKFLRETALVDLPHNHGKGGQVYTNLPATTTHSSSISPVLASSNP